MLLDLFLTFAKIGLFTFGGGYAMIALIENNCVEHKAGWNYYGSVSYLYFML